jgi:hypothetical protein
MNTAPPTAPRPSPAHVVNSQARREQVRAVANRLLPQPGKASHNCAFVAALLGTCGRPLLYNPFPALQAVLLQMAGGQLVPAERDPSPGDVYVVAEAGEVVDLGVVKVAGAADWFVAVDGAGEPYRRARGSVAYWLRFG